MWGSIGIKTQGVVLGLARTWQESWIKNNPVNQKTNSPSAAVLSLSPPLLSFSDKSWNTTNTEDHVGGLCLSAVLLLPVPLPTWLVRSPELSPSPSSPSPSSVSHPTPSSLAPASVAPAPLVWPAPICGHPPPSEEPSVMLVLYIKRNCTRLFQNNSRPHYLNVFREVDEWMIVIA